MKDFLEDYKKYTIEAFFDEFLHYMHDLGWYDGGAQQMKDYFRGTGSSWRLSPKFATDILDFSKHHWSCFLDIMKEQGYVPYDVVTKMKEIYDICSVTPWFERWKNRK